jgi:hypothetical protein
VLERLRESFNVGIPGLAGAEAALADQAHLRSVRGLQRRERDWLRGELARAACGRAFADELPAGRFRPPARRSRRRWSARRGAAADGRLRPARLPAHHARHARRQPRLLAALDEARHEPGLAGGAGGRCAAACACPATSRSRTAR